MWAPGNGRWVHETELAATRSLLNTLLFLFLFLLLLCCYCYCYCYSLQAVFYTDCITLKENVPVIWANRSMCWLKMSEAAKALADADKSISLDANYTKAHFRRGVARETDEDIKGVRGCACFSWFRQLV